MDIDRITTLEHTLAPRLIRQGYWPGMILIFAVSAIAALYAALIASGTLLLCVLLCWLVLSFLWRIGCESVLAIFALVPGAQTGDALPGAEGDNNPHPDPLPLAPDRPVKGKRSRALPVSGPVSGPVREPVPGPVSPEGAAIPVAPPSDTASAASLRDERGRKRAQPEGGKGARALASSKTATGSAAKVARPAPSEPAEKLKDTGARSTPPRPRPGPRAKAQ